MMATAVVRSLLCGLLGWQFLLTGAQTSNDLSKCEISTSSALPLDNFMQNLPSGRNTLLYVTAVTRDMLPNTVNKLFSIKPLEDDKYEVYVTFNVQDPDSGKIECIAHRYIAIYNATNRQLQSEANENGLVLEVYLLAFALTGQSALYVEFKRDGQIVDNLTMINMVTSDPSIIPQLSLARDKVQEICDKNVDDDGLFHSVSVDATMEPNCGN